MSYPPVVTVLRVEQMSTGDPARRVSCPQCRQEDWLRLVLIGALVVIWCEHGHVHADPHITPERVALWISPDTPRWELRHGAVPEELQRAHPGITEVLARIGHHYLVSTGDTPVPHPYPLPHGRDWPRIEDLANAFLDDQPVTEESSPDEVVLVPMTRREMRLLGRATDRRDPVDEPTRILREFVMDLQRRAEALITTDSDHVRQVADEHARTIRHLLLLIAIRRSAQR